MYNAISLHMHIISTQLTNNQNEDAQCRHPFYLRQNPQKYAVRATVFITIVFISSKLSSVWSDSFIMH